MLDKENPLQSRENVLDVLRGIIRNPHAETKDIINASNRIAEILGLKAKREEADWRKQPQRELEENVKTLIEDSVGPYAEIEWVAAEGENRFTPAS